MNLLDLMVRIGVDDRASDVVGKLRDKTKSAAASMGKAMVAGAAAVGAATVAIGKQALDAYSAYEQNLGGIQKLYGNMGKTVEEYAEMNGTSVDKVKDKWKSLEKAQDTVLKNASNAWQTAGMSANQYMEQATSFSASLITSLHNDTNKAAKYTDIAMTDMSDNVNTFGSNMEDVQNAYQGFAKQNYTMLDNLKLGYGGTQSEMKRLVSDASKMTDVQKELGVTVDGSSLSFSNIVAAIHVMQKQMQIGGTTAREAATTIEGSVNAMKAAWENWLAALGNDDVDMGAMTQNLATAFENVASNVLPRIGEIFGTLVGQVPQALQEVLPAVAEALQGAFDSMTSAFQSSGASDAIAGYLNELPDMFRNGLNSVVAAFQEYFPQVMDAGVGLVTYIVQGITQALPEIGTALGGMLSGIGGYLAENGGTLISGALEMLSDLSGALREGFGTLVDGAIGMLQGLVQGIADALPAFFQNIPQIVSNIAGLINDNAPKLLDAAIGMIGTLAMGLVQAIPALVASIPQIIQAVVDTLMAFNWASAGLKLVGFLKDGIVGGVKTVAGAAKNLLNGITGGLKALPQRLVSVARGAVKRFGESIAGLAGWVKTKAWKIASTIETTFRTLPGKLVEIGSNLIKGLWNGISNVGAWVFDKISGFCNGIVDKVKGLFGINSPSRVFAEIGKYMMLGWGKGITANGKKVVGAMADVASGVLDAASVGIAAPQAVPVAAGSAASQTRGTSGGIVINLNYTADADATQMANDIAWELGMLGLTGA